MYLVEEGRDEEYIFFLLTMLQCWTKIDVVIIPLYVQI